jgi:hypothetical protein
MHISGDFVPDDGEFSSSKWIQTTEMYLDKTKNDLTADNWTEIFRAMYRLKEADARSNQIEMGAPLTPVPREALLPDDPPTPPP